MSLSYKVDMVMANPLQEKWKAWHAGFKEKHKILFSGIYYCRNKEKQ